MPWRTHRKSDTLQCCNSAVLVFLALSPLLISAAGDPRKGATSSATSKKRFMAGSRACQGQLPGLSSGIKSLSRVECEILEALWRMNHPDDCSSARVLVLDFDGFQGDGFASIVHRTASSIAEAFYENRTVVLGPTALAYKPGPWNCAGHDLFCYFLPFTACGLEDTTAQERALLYQDGFDDASRLKLADEMRGNVAALVCPVEFRDELRRALGDDSPDSLVHQTWTSLVYNFVFRPRKEVLEFLWKEAVWMGWTGSVKDDLKMVGVHVRRGDTQHATWKKQTYELSAYLDAGLEQAALAGSRHLYIATDSPRVASELQDVPSDSRDVFSLVRLIVPKRQRLPERWIRDQADSVASFAQARGGKEAQTLAIESLSDIFFLSECDGLVGTGSSHFVAVANALRPIKGKTLPPFYLDANNLQRGLNSVGLFHIANLPQQQEELKALRWQLVRQRFVANSLAPLESGAEFYFDVQLGMPRVPVRLFDKEVLKWNVTAPLLDVCPTQHLPSRTWGAAEVVNLGAKLHGLMKFRAALSCFLTAAQLGNNPEHKEIARQNAEVLRRDVAGFLSRTTLSPRENRSGAGRPAREEAEREAVRSEKRSWSEDAPLTTAERYQAIIGKHFTPVNCSLASRDPVELANFAADVLYPSGRLSEALFCLDAAALLLKSLQPAAAPSLAAISKNLDTMVQVLRPGERNRVYHNVGKKGATFPDHMSREHVAGTEDQTIQVWDGALSSHQCEKIIEMFERSDHYEGNLISEGKIIVDHKVKKASEYEVSEGARKSSEWAEIEQMLLSVFVNHTILYEEKNPILRQLKNPFGDEGFRMKRYLDDGTEHHAYHADSGQEAPCAPRRVVAFLVYFNGVEGGETVFLQQGRIVSPKCGRVLMFPTSFSHVHAGRPPTKGWKYNAINFLTIQ